MNKRELVKAVAAESGFTGVEAARAANAMLRVIAQSLQRGERVSVPGFGAFSVRDRKGRGSGRDQRRDAEHLTEKYEKPICPRRIGRNPDARLGGCHGAGER